MEASCKTSLQIAKQKKLHTIGETLIKSCMLEAAQLVLNNASANRLKQISLSNNTVKERMQDMSQDIMRQVVEKILVSPFFSIQLDEPTDMAQCPQLLV